MRKKNNIWQTGLILVLLLQACSTTRVIDEGEFLYTGSGVEVTAPRPADIRERKLEKQLEEAASSQTNRELFGFIPLKLWLYNLAGDSVPEKGFRRWIKNSLGEPPVLFRSYSIEARETEIDNTLRSKGYFSSNIRTEQVRDGKKMSLLHHVEVQEPYRFGQLGFPRVTDTLTRYIADLQQETIIKQGQQFSLQDLKRERERIEEGLKNKGFYYFLGDYLYFRLDTLGDSARVNMEMAVKANIPAEAGRIYSIGRVFVHHDSLQFFELQSPDTTDHHGIGHIAGTDISVEQDLLDRAIKLESGNRYNHEAYLATLNMLSDLGIYKFVKIKFTEGTGDTLHTLDPHIFLTRSLPKSIQAEVKAVSKSNDFTGPGLDISYLDRNFNARAASFRLRLNAGFETQLLAGGEGLNNIELGAGAELDYPVLLAPRFFTRIFDKGYMNPRTRILAGADYYNRSGLFSVRTLDFSFSYYWKNPASRSQHEISLFTLDYQRLQNISGEQDVETYLSRTYPQQFITSLQYSYTINNLKEDGIFTDYLKFSVEPAGTLPGMFGNLAGNAGGDSIITGIFGIPFARYLRLYSDYRTYFEVSRGSDLVARLVVGAGIPYGNSTILPYKKRFYAGGATSIRAFPSRSVGPGSYLDTAEGGSGSRLGRNGDLKLEGSLEYRFDIVRYLKGALFVDAGNIWLYRADETLPGGAFQWDEFTGELAVGGGAGLRLDISFFVLRLDVAFPFRKPYLPPGNRWVIDDVSFGSKNWRQENIVYNVAIGYPF